MSWNQVEKGFWANMTEIEELKKNIVILWIGQLLLSLVVLLLSLDRWVQ